MVEIFSYKTNEFHAKRVRRCYCIRQSWWNVNEPIRFPASVSKLFNTFTFDNEVRDVTSAQAGASRLVLQNSRRNFEFLQLLFSR